ncbi:hypothetical protein ACWEP4_38725, partial [Streptomyces sp. NPDC004227]
EARQPVADALRRYSPGLPLLHRFPPLTQCSRRWRTIARAAWRTRSALSIRPLREAEQALWGPGEPIDGEDQEQGVPAAADPAVVIDVPGLLVEHLQGTEDAAVRDALRDGRTIWRGKGYSLRVTAPLSVHQAALEACAALAVDGAAPAGRKAYRVYANRVEAAPAARGMTAGTALSA